MYIYIYRANPSPGAGSQSRARRRGWRCSIYIYIYIYIHTYIYIYIYIYIHTYICIYIYIYTIHIWSPGAGSRNLGRRRGWRCIRRCLARTGTTSPRHRQSRPTVTHTEENDTGQPENGRERRDGFVYTHIYIYICIYLYICLYMNRYTHTHIYIYVTNLVCETPNPCGRREHGRKRLTVI